MTDHAAMQALRAALDDDGDSLSVSREVGRHIYNVLARRAANVQSRTALLPTPPSMLFDISDVDVVDFNDDIVTRSDL